MSVYNRPYEWARGMNRLVMDGKLNAGDFQQDVLNAIVAVTDVNNKNTALKSENARLRKALEDVTESINPYDVAWEALSTEAVGSGDTAEQGGGEVKWVECSRNEAEEVMWKKNSVWLGWMPVHLCVFPEGAEYQYRKRTNTTDQPLEDDMSTEMLARVSDKGGE